MEGELLLRVVLLVPKSNQKPNLMLQSATRRSFWDKKSRPTGRSLWTEGVSLKLYTKNRMKECNSLSSSTKMKTRMKILQTIKITNST